VKSHENNLTWTKKQVIYVASLMSLVSSGQMLGRRKCAGIILRLALTPCEREAEGDFGMFFREWGVN